MDFEQKKATLQSLTWLEFSKALRPAMEQVSRCWNYSTSVHKRLEALYQDLDRNALSKPEEKVSAEYIKEFSEAIPICYFDLMFDIMDTGDVDLPKIQDSLAQCDTDRIDVLLNWIGSSDRGATWSNFADILKNHSFRGPWDIYKYNQFKYMKRVVEEQSIKIPEDKVPLYFIINIAKYTPRSYFEIIFNLLYRPMMPLKFKINLIDTIWDLGPILRDKLDGK